MKRECESFPITQGDLDSEEMGTGARSGDGKLPVALIPVRHWVTLLHTLRVNAGESDPEGAAMVTSLEALAAFQEGKSYASVILQPIWPSWFDAACDVFEYGTKKYKKYNWMKGMPWSVPMACAIRHMKSILIDGEEFDKESGLLHIGHYTCNVIMLAQYSGTYRRGNDFPPPKYFIDAHE